MMKSFTKFVLAGIAVAIFAKNGDCATTSRNATRATEVFRADFSKSSISAAFDNTPIGYGEHNVILWASGGGIDVVYPAGSYSPAGPIIGGFGLWSNHPVPSGTAIFQFSVFFPEGFNFVMGGKLPGLYGGRTLCAGGDEATDCFSTRIMWREEGKGELYLYANREAQDPAICEMPGNYCAPTYGWSLNTGAFTFQTGVWTHLEERITMNTPGQRDGILVIYVNGEEKIRYNNLVFRIADYPNMIVAGLDVDTFFGGGSPPWATPTRQITKFKDFILSVEN